MDKMYEALMEKCAGMKECIDALDSHPEIFEKYNSGVSVETIAKEHNLDAIFLNVLLNTTVLNSNDEKIKKVLLEDKNNSIYSFKNIAEMTGLSLSEIRFSLYKMANLKVFGIDFLWKHGIITAQTLCTVEYANEYIERFDGSSRKLQSLAAGINYNTFRKGAAAAKKREKMLSGAEGLNEFLKDSYYFMQIHSKDIVKGLDEESSRIVEENIIKLYGDIFPEEFYEEKKEEN